MNTKLVSIIIPCYNCAQYLSETLDSVIKQTYQNSEIIIVDDGSKDESINIIKKYQTNYPSKIEFYHNPGKGACAARNYGFSKSKGQYIQFLDGDDLLSETKIEMQLSALLDKKGCLAVCETWHFYNTIDKAKNTDSPYFKSSTTPTEFFSQLWGGKELPPNMVQTSAWLVPRELIESFGGWNEALSKDQDGEFFARLGLNSKGIIYVKNIKNYYRKHIGGNNIAAKNDRKHIESIIISTDLKAKYLLSQTQLEDAKMAIATQFKWMAIEGWPQFPDLTKEALQKCQQLGGSEYCPVLGGRIIELIKKVFGWKIAKGFSFYAHKLI